MLDARFTALHAENEYNFELQQVIDQSEYTQEDFNETCKHAPITNESEQRLATLKNTVERQTMITAINFGVYLGRQGFIGLSRRLDKLRGVDTIRNGVDSIRG